MVFALLPTVALAVAGESTVPITIQEEATTAKVRASRLEVESVSWSGDTVTIKVKVKDDQPFTVFAKNASDIFVTVNGKQIKTVEKVDEMHITVTCSFAEQTEPNYAELPGYIVLQPAHTKEELEKKWETCRPMVDYGADPFEVQTSATPPYAIGKLKDNVVEDGLNFLNYTRYSLGLPEVTIDEELQDRAHYGAVLLAASTVFGHTQPKPAGMDEAFYQRGYESTTHSNICGNGQVVGQLLVSAGFRCM